MAPKPDVSLPLDILGSTAPISTGTMAMTSKRLYLFVDNRTVSSQSKLFKYDITDPRNPYVMNITGSLYWTPKNGLIISYETSSEVVLIQPRVNGFNIFKPE